MLNLYFLKSDSGWEVRNQLTDQHYGTVSSIRELDQFITYDLDGNITHQDPRDPDCMYGWIPRKSYKAFRAWYSAPEGLDMRIVPENNYRQRNALRIEAIMPEPRCFAAPKDQRGIDLVNREYGYYFAVRSYTSFHYCTRPKCALCPVYLRMAESVA